VNDLAVHIRLALVGLLLTVGPSLLGACEPDPADPDGDTAQAEDVVEDTAAPTDTATPVNAAPSAPEVVIDPASPTTGDELIARATATDDGLPSDTLTYTYRWLRDGADEGDTGQRLPASRTARGEVWTVEARASDGLLEGPAGSAVTTIVDTPPTLGGAALDRTEVSVLETLTCTSVGYADADGDPEALRIRWYQLGDDDARTLLAEDTATFSPAALEAGDRVLCELTLLWNDAPYGDPVVSPVATLVAATAPEVTVAAPDGVDGEATCEITTPAAHVGDSAITTFYWTVNGGAELLGDATRGGLVDCDLLTCRAEVSAGELTLSSEPASLALPVGPACATTLACHGPVCAAGGGCATEPLTGDSCASLDPCLGPGTCDAGACVPSSAPSGDGVSCDDGDPCTVGTVCAAGACTGGSAADDGTPCDDGDPCTVDDQCAAAVCVGGAAAGDGALCDDGDGCTAGDACLAGVCEPGAPVDCSAAGGACAVGGCQSTSASAYQCVATNRPAGAACNAPDLCATAAHCDGAGQCVEGAPTAISDARVLKIDIAAHELDTVKDAIWDVVVERADGTGEPLLATRVSSSQCGEGGTAASVEASCDAAGEGEVVKARLRGMYTDLVLDPGRFGDPVPEGGITFADPGDLVRTVECLDLPSNDVSYDVSIARPAEGGFFTKSVAFDQIYCSANFTCCSDDDDDGDCDADVDLLFDANGDRNTTFKLGFACAAETSANMDLALYMDDLVLTCDGTDIVTIHPAAGDGNLCSPGNVGGCTPKVDVSGAGAGYVFQAAVYKGESSFSGIDRVWWNVALGVDKAVVAAGSCQLTTKATADTAAVAGGVVATSPGGYVATPDVYPYLVWDVAVSDGTNVTCVEHAPGDLPAYVYAAYTDDNATANTVFQWDYNP